MAAYGALLSLMNTIHQIQNHPRPPISLDKLQIEPLIEMVTYLLHYIENYTIDDADGLVERMTYAAREAEDIVESYIADHIEARGKANISSKSGSSYRYMKKKIQKTTLHINNSSLYRNLQKVIHDLRFITKDVAAIKDEAGENIAPSNDAMVGSESDDDVMNNIMDKLSVPYSEGDDTMAGVMNDIMDKLTNQQSSRWIIAITGMGGIGKTTLTKRIYENPLIVEQFDIRGWATVSQEFDSKRILLQVLDCLKKTMGSEDSEYEELGQKLYQSLYGRRYLIVMDDIWGTDAWDGVKRFFPDNKDRSKVLLTTRLSNVALQLDGPDYFQMPFLKVDESWNLLRRCVFQKQQGCPSELEEIGKDIATNCGGLPLSIVVIGGLLAKSERTRENWQHVLENLSSIVNLEEDERCFRILKLSYNQLPVHLKPCFLYMGMFPEDHMIHVPTLLKLWVDEGFVKTVAGKSLESIAREVYLHGLVIRNLILVRAWGCTRRIKLCGIHDLMRDLCIKEAQKYKFFRTTQNLNNVHDKSWRNQRRIGIHEAGSKWYDIPPPLPKDVRSASRARTLIFQVNGCIPSIASFRLLRVLKGLDKSYFSCHAYPGQDLFLPVNLCHLAAARGTEQLPVEVLYRLWNLRTLILDKYSSYEFRGSVLDIWRMPQLRQVKVFDLLLTDPPPLPPMDEENGDRMVLQNLETLKTVYNFKCSEELVERIPNIKKLGISGGYGLDNLCRLRKLEGLSISYSLLRSRPIEVRSFPVSLRKLTLEGTMLGCEEMGRKIGSLPYLEVLKLHEIAFVGAPEWETAEGGFPSLKYLQINSCPDLEEWRAEATHFPRLERLDLWYLHNLKEIPLGIGEITTLREIRVSNCSDSAVLSTKKILEEQEECYGDMELQIRVSLCYDTQLQKESLRSRNLHFSDFL